MSLPLETAESPFKNKNSLGQVLVDGNDLDISNINCYLQLLAQTASKKEKLRRKKRRERREKKKTNSSKERRKARREREGKEKEVEPDVGPADMDRPMKMEYSTHHKAPSHSAGEHSGGLLVAPTLPSQSAHPNGSMGRAASSPTNDFEYSLTSAAPAMAQSPYAHSRSGSWSQFIIDHSHQQDGAGYVPNYPVSQPLLHRSPPMNAAYQPAHMDQSLFMSDPATEFLQMMSEHQSTSNPSFTFSSSFSSGSLSPIVEDPMMGFPISSTSSSTAFGQQAANFGGSSLFGADAQMHQQHLYSTGGDLFGLSSSASSSFGMDPVDDRDGTFASLDFLEAALSHDMRGM